MLLEKTAAVAAGVAPIQQEPPRPHKIAISEKEKVKRLLLLTVLSLVILMIAGLSVWYYGYTHFNMFGK